MHKKLTRLKLASLKLSEHTGNRRNKWNGQIEEIIDLIFNMKNTALLKLKQS